VDDTAWLMGPIVVSVLDENEEVCATSAGIFACVVDCCSIGVIFFGFND
jgi:hypothetical protein